MSLRIRSPQLREYLEEKLDQLSYSSDTGAYTIDGDLTVTGSISQAGSAVAVETSYYAALTVGLDDEGYDVKFYGATTGKYWLWDESEDEMVIKGTVDITGATAITGALTQTGAATVIGALTVGVNDTGHDVKFYGATSGSYWMWDESGDDMIVVGDSQFTGAVTVGVDDTGHDVKFYGATASSYLLWDESEDMLVLDAADLKLGDADILSFGDADDVQIRWDGTDLDILAAADASIIKFGNGTADFDIWIYAGSNTVVFNEGDSKAVFDGYDIQLNDADELRFGDLAAGDIVMNFDGTNFEIEGAAAATSVLVGAAGKVLNTTLHGSITVGVDDTGYDVKFFGATSGAYMLWDESADELVFATGASIDLTADEVMIDFKAGTASTATIGTSVPAGWINVAVAGTTVYIPYWTVDGE